MTPDQREDLDERIALIWDGTLTREPITLGGSRADRTGADPAARAVAAREGHGMRIRWSNGMVAYSSTDTWDTACVRVQVYWPEIVVRTTELRAMFRTTFRLVWNQRERGIGFQVLGFGAGIAWEPAGIKVTG